MRDIRYAALAALSVTLLFGTYYSVLHDTYLDTSDPLLSHLPHPLGKSHYFANKSNILNVYFIKKAWAWTSATFLVCWLTSPPSTRTARRVMEWGMETVVWVLFTLWFFGPALLERVILASGGECVLSLPSGEQIAVPQQYCFSRSSISPANHPHFFTASLVASEWHGTPRLRKGHDVSGHVFLLTMSVLFLADQLKHSLRVRQWSSWHNLAVVFNVTLIGVWVFAGLTTGLYFHTPFEKFTGYLLGVAGFAITQFSFTSATSKSSLRKKDSPKLHEN